MLLQTGGFKRADGTDVMAQVRVTTDGLLEFWVPECPDDVQAAIDAVAMRLDHRAAVRRYKDGIGLILAKIAYPVEQ